MVDNFTDVKFSWVILFQVVDYDVYISEHPPAEVEDFHQSSSPQWNP